MPSNFYVVAKTAREFVIPFIGLKPGIHSFEFEINDTFFEGLEYSIIHSGDVHVTLELDKKETMLIGDFSIEGKVKTNCDRCNDPVDVEVEGEYQLIYKFGTEPSDDETLIIIEPDAYEIDVAPNIYELITVSLPTRLIHEEGECNEDMMDALDEYLLNPDDEEDEDWDDEDEDEGDDDDEDDDDIDPRWSALKNLN